MHPPHPPEPRVLYHGLLLTLLTLFYSDVNFVSFPKTPVPWPGLQQALCPAEPRGGRSQWQQWPWVGLSPVWVQLPHLHNKETRLAHPRDHFYLKNTRLRKTEGNMYLNLYYVTMSPYCWAESIYGYHLLSLLATLGDLPGKKTATQGGSEVHWHRLLSFAVVMSHLYYHLLIFPSWFTFFA